MSDFFSSILSTSEVSKYELIWFNLYLSVTFLGLTLGLFVFILFSRWRDRIRSVSHIKAEKDIQNFLTSYIFDDYVEEEAIEAFTRKYAYSKRDRQILLEAIVSLHKNLIGETADKLCYLYQRFGLQRFSKHKLYSSYWSQVAKGIGELADMGISKYSDLIRTFINHPHPILRSEAQVALIKLNTSAPFSFLDELREPLQDWQQLQLARAAYKSQLLSIPDFEPWLNNREDSIVIFCLRMISFYGQRNTPASIIRLLKHPSAKVREEAVITLRQLEAYDAVPMLIAMFANETTDIQLEILKTLPAIGDYQSIPFLEQVLIDDNRHLQLAAAKAMCQSGQEGQARMQAIKNDPGHTLQQIAATALKL